MFKKLQLVALGGVVALTPVLAAAQWVPGGPSLKDWIVLVYKVFLFLPKIAIAVIIVILLYNVVRYIALGSDQKARQEAIRGLITTIIALAIVLSIWGLIAFLGATFRIGQGGDLRPELIPTVSGVDIF